VPTSGGITQARPVRVIEYQVPGRQGDGTGELLTHFAISALICQAATEADIDPDRVKFTRTVRIIRRAIAPAAFPP